LANSHGNICEYIEVCGFFNAATQARMTEMDDLIHLYCHGGDDLECARKRFLLAIKRPPPDGMLPNGQMLRA